MAFDVREYAKKRKENEASGNNSSSGGGGFDVQGYVKQRNLSKVGEYLNSSLKSWKEKNARVFIDFQGRFKEGNYPENTYRSDASDWYTDFGSRVNELRVDADREAALDPSLLVTETTPPAFVWHTHTDQAVEVCNTYRYGEALRHAGVLAEVHVFPEGVHGMGLSFHEPHVGQWTPLLLNWLDRYL
jgi:hypothetical protein